MPHPAQPPRFLSASKLANCDQIENIPSMLLEERITIEPGKRSGKPCIRGMRITVYDVFEWLASGMTPETIIKEYPELTLEDIQACYKYAANREKRLLSA
jgi:uncharacterized protein (DUF433 family)